MCPVVLLLKKSIRFEQLVHRRTVATSRKNGEISKPTSENTKDLTLRREPKQKNTIEKGNGEGLGSHEESAQQPGGDSPPRKPTLPYCCRNSTKPIAHAPRHKQANREQSEARAEGDERRLDTGSSVPSQFTIHPSLSGGNEPTENQEYEE